MVGTDDQLFGYAGLYVGGGSALPVKVWVNPGLTITALAEQAMILVGTI
jgi:choline dehydrogenase-like flavoprotein